MSALHVALHALWTQHSVIERKFFPRFEPDHLIAAHFQLYAALLPAETAVRFHQALGRIPRLVLPASRRDVSWMGPERFKQDIRSDRRLSHEILPSASTERAKAT